MKHRCVARNHLPVPHSPVTSPLITFWACGRSVALLILLAGCRDAPCTTYLVTGKLTVRGQPAAEADLRFYDTSGEPPGMARPTPGPRERPVHGLDLRHERRRTGGRVPGVGLVERSLAWHFAGPAGCPARTAAGPLWGSGHLRHSSPCGSRQQRVGNDRPYAVMRLWANLRNWCETTLELPPPALSRRERVQVRKLSRTNS